MTLRIVRMCFRSVRSKPAQHVIVIRTCYECRAALHTCGAQKSAGEPMVILLDGFRNVFVIPAKIPQQRRSTIQVVKFVLELTFCQVGGEHVVRRASSRKAGVPRGGDWRAKHTWRGARHYFIAVARRAHFFTKRPSGCYDISAVLIKHRLAIAYRRL